MEAKTKNTVLVAISVLLGVAYLLAGLAKVVFSPEEAAAQFEAFGLPAGMAAFIGLCEIAGGIGLMIPRLAGLAASGLVVIMLGAVYSHANHDPLPQALPALILGGLCAFVAWSRGLPFRSRAGTNA